MPSGKKKVTAGHSLAALEPRPDDLGGLIERTANGEEAALAALYDATASLVNGLALRVLGDRGSAEEVTGDVYLQVWRQAVRYDGTRGAPLAWLLTLTRSRAIDRLRTGASQRARTAPIEAALRVASAVRQRRQVVRSALTHLPAEQRRAIELAYFEGLSHSEIAATLGEPLGTVKTRVRLGMIRLRESLGSAGKDLL
jgi:RNA polymerase sigma-70 factor (ECF subfamily)